MDLWLILAVVVVGRRDTGPVAAFCIERQRNTISPRLCFSSMATNIWLSSLPRFELYDQVDYIY